MTALLSKIEAVKLADRQDAYGVVRKGILPRVEDLRNRRRGWDADCLPG